MEFIISDIEIDDLIYSINKKENTAAVIGYKTINDHIIIPRSIIYESTEYIIKSIEECAFKRSTSLKSVEFAPNSEVSILKEKAFASSSIERITIPPRLTKISEYTFYSCRNFREIEIPNNSELYTIGSGAFSHSLIKSLFFPENLTELEEGWCNSTNDLTEIKIMPKNRHFILFDNQYILQKSNPDQSNYDTLVFAVRNIEIVKIPNFIEIIGKYAFNSCQLIQKIDISENTKLRIIDKFAFYGCTSINHIKIPLHLTSIEEGAFFFV